MQVITDNCNLIDVPTLRRSFENMMRREQHYVWKLKADISNINGQFIERELNISFELNFNARLTHESTTSIGSISSRVQLISHLITINLISRL
jgi:hypothetical protein